MTSYNIGDKVKVFDLNSSKMGQPEGGWDGAKALAEAIDVWVKDGTS